MKRKNITERHKCSKSQKMACLTGYILAHHHFKGRHKKTVFFFSERVRGGLAESKIPYQKKMIFFWNFWIFSPKGGVPPNTMPKGEGGVSEFQSFSEEKTVFLMPPLRAPVGANKDCHDSGSQFSE